MIDSRYNNRTFADKFNEWTGQPVFWAAIASLGLHGILFAALPSFSSSATDLDERTVSVVELGAEELSRLPSFPELDTPNLPDGDDPYDLDPLENWDQVLKDLGIEDQEPSVPASPGLLNPPLPRSPVRTSPPRPLTSPLFDFTRPGRVVIPRTSTITPSPSPTPTPSSTPAPSSTPTPSPPTPQELQAANPQDIGNEVNDPLTPADGPVEGENNQEQPIEPTPQELEADLVARLLSENQQRQKAIAYLSGVQQIPDLYTKWSSATASDDFSLTSSGEFPLDACLAGQDASVMLGVLVGRNNKPISNKNIPNPIFINLSAQEFISADGESAGANFDPDAYSLLDETAFELSQAYPYEAEDGANTRRRYFHTINFNYDEEACDAYMAAQQSESAGAVDADNPGNSDSASNGANSDASNGASETPAGPSEVPQPNADPIDLPVDTPLNEAPGETLPEDGESSSPGNPPEETPSSSDSAPATSSSASDLELDETNAGGE